MSLTKKKYENRDSKEVMKMDLCKAIISFKETQDITQKKLADLAGLTEPQISEVMNYRIDRFTIDFLLDVIDKINSRKKEDQSIQSPVKKIA